jgi:hypothetical protein
MKIAFHTWDPGLWSDKPNSAGGSGWIRYLWAWLQLTDHEVLWLGTQDIPDIKKLRLNDINKADVVVLFWRWAMHKSYKERNAAQLRQNQIIDAVMPAGVPLLIHDQDHKMMSVETESFKGQPNVILAAPELNPRQGFRQLMYPNPHVIRPPLENRYYFMTRTQLLYIGNNYERWDQFREFIIKPSNLGLRTEVFGNWLEEHPKHSERQTPEEVVRAAPNIEFRGRLGQNLIQEVYMMADCTVHLAKPSYMETGFVTMRWAEAAAAGTLGFVPVGFKGLPKELRPAYVQDGEDLVKRYKSFTEDEWLKLVMAQQEWVRENMSPDKWSDLIKEAASA